MPSDVEPKATVLDSLRESPNLGVLIEHDDGAPLARQLVRGCKTGRPCADDDDRKVGSERNVHWVLRGVEGGEYIKDEGLSIR